MTANLVHTPALEPGLPQGMEKIIALCVSVCVCVCVCDGGGEGTEKEVPELWAHPCFKGCFESRFPKAHVTCDTTLTLDPEPSASSQRPTLP